MEAEYHRTPHRGLNGATPLDRWLEKASDIIAFDPSIDLDHAFMHEITRKVYRDSTFTLNGVLYEVPSSLIGQRITLRYDPRVPAQRRRLTVFVDQTECGTARIVDSYANTKVRRTNLHKDLAAETKPDSKDPTVDQPPSITDSSLAASELPFPDPDRDQENSDA